jgi:DNA-binding response OmpR family regulator
VPVVILTALTAERDVFCVYEHHVNSYLVKPVDYAQFSQLLHDLGFYWLNWNYYPES